MFDSLLILFGAALDAALKTETPGAKQNKLDEVSSDLRVYGCPPAGAGRHHWAPRCLGLTFVVTAGLDLTSQVEMEWLGSSWLADFQAEVE